MIDFRYHLVSLVSVFLALAVGIALGAGPLKGPISSTLNKDLASLRQAKQELGAQLDTAQAGIQHRDDFTTAVTPALIDKQLGGRSVVLVTVPQSDTAGIKALTDGLKTAGAKVTGRIDIKTPWIDPADSDTRDQLVAQLSGDLPADAGSNLGTAKSLDVLLARALVTAEIIDSGRTDATAQAILSALKDAGLISVNGDLGGRATEAVVLVPPVQQVVTGPDVTPSQSPTADYSTVWRELTSALDSGSNGAVVLGPASSAAAGGVIAAVRSDTGIAKAVSTVDTGGTPMGVIAAVLALREQLSGAAGSYGFGDGAKSALPALTTSAP